MRTTKHKSSPLAATEEEQPQAPADDGSEDELSPEQPTLSLPPDPHGQDEDSFDAPAPRLSMPLDEYDHTARSVEIGRRQSARRSMGDTRTSDRFAYSHLPNDMSRIGSENSVIVPADQDLDELSGPVEYVDQR